MAPSSPSPALPLNTPSKPSTSNSNNSTGTSTPAKAAPYPTDISSPHELTAFVESLLEQLDTKFDDMSSQILDRMMQMSGRVDALEAAIHDIINGDNVPTSPGLSQSPSVSRRNGNAAG